MAETGITPWPTPRGAAVLLFGGTFDPPHRAHIELAAHARDAAMPPAAWIVFVPAARNPLKSTGPTAGDADRAAMLRLAIGDVPRAAVWTDEIDRADAGRPSYWVETLERARAVIEPGTPLRFVIGADQAVAFGSWREPARMLALAEPLVLLRRPYRDPASFAAAIDAAPALRADREAWLRRVVPAPVREESSTSFREGDADILHPAVRAYIARHGLYGRTPGSAADA